MLDAPVLARGMLTSFLLALAEAGAFDPVWSEQIHGEWAKDLQRLRHDIPVAKLRHRRAELDRAFPVASVTASRDAIDEVLANCTTAAERKSAHVLAIALSARAAVIVTDEAFCLTAVMARLWHDIAVLSPDAFCVELLDRHETTVLPAIHAHRVLLGRAEAWTDLLAALPATAARLAQSRPPS